MKLIWDYCAKLALMYDFIEEIMKKKQKHKRAMRKPVKYEIGKKEFHQILDKASQPVKKPEEDT